MADIFQGQDFKELESRQHLQGLQKLCYCSEIVREAEIGHREDDEEWLKEYLHRAACPHVSFPGLCEQILK